jgi:hypothetical protein
MPAISVFNHHLAILPHPPKRYWGVWGHFLRNHIEPILPNIILKWHQNCQLRQFSTFYKHTRTPHLYHKDQDGLTVFPLNRRQNKGYLQLCSIYLWYSFLPQWVLPSGRASTQTGPFTSWTLPLIPDKRLTWPPSRVPSGCIWSASIPTLTYLWLSQISCRQWDLITEIHPTIIKTNPAMLHLSYKDLHMHGLFLLEKLITLMTQKKTYQVQGQLMVSLHTFLE